MGRLDWIEPAFDTEQMFRPASSTVAQLHDLIQRRDAVPAATYLPVHPTLAEAFPQGLRAGVVYSLIGSTSLALGLLAGPSQHGSWCAVVGMPDVSVEAAADWGVDLDRLILVPDPGHDHWTTAVSTLLEVADLIVASPAQLSGGEVNRLTSRLRSRRSTLIVTGHWPRATTMTVTTVQWEGLGQGHGAILRRKLRLDITERGRQRSIQLTLPATS